MLRIRTTLAALAMAAAVVTACAGDGGGSLDGSTGPDAPVPTTPVGSYVLKTVDGKPLPAPMGKPIVDKDYTIVARALSGAFTFNANGTYLFTAEAEVVATGIEYRQPVSITRAGTYAFDASTITLTSTSGVTTMSRAGTTLTSAVTVPAAGGGMETVTMVFQR